jgi:hypothetical protein
LAIEIKDVTEVIESVSERSVDASDGATDALELREEYSFALAEVVLGVLGRGGKDFRLSLMGSLWISTGKGLGTAEELFVEDDLARYGG